MAANTREPTSNLAKGAASSPRQNLDAVALRLPEHL
jgi:hypothetical protein